MIHSPIIYSFKITIKSEYILLDIFVFAMHIIGIVKIGRSDFIKKIYLEQKNIKPGFDYPLKISTFLNTLFLIFAKIYRLNTYKINIKNYCEIKIVHKYIIFVFHFNGKMRKSYWYLF